MALLEHKLREAEAARAELEQTRARLEREVRLRELSLEIDQTKCLTLRSEQCQGRDTGWGQESVENQPSQVSSHWESPGILMGSPGVLL